MRDDERLYKLLVIAGMEHQRSQRVDKNHPGHHIIVYQSRLERDRKFHRHNENGRVHTLSGRTQ